MFQRTQRKMIALDTDHKTLIEVARIARSWYEVLSTNDPRRAKNWLSEHTDIAVIVADHATQQFEGKSLLDYVRTELPNIQRVVMTSYSDLSKLIEGLHTGAIQKLVQKPINVNELTAAIVPFEAQAAGLSAAARAISRVG